MPMFDEKHVKLCGGIIVWDGVTRPEPQDGGGVKKSLKLVFPPGNPDVALLDQLAARTLAESEFRGVLPNGGRMPIGVARPDEFNGMFPGWAVVNFGTYREPDVYDEAGRRLEPMQYGPLLYGGQRVDVLVHCYSYNNKNKGISAGLDGFQIIVSANAPRQNFGGSGVDTASAFGGQPQGGQPQYGQPQGGPQQYGQPQGGQPQYGQPQGGPQQYVPPQGGQPQYGQPQGGPQQYVPPQGGTAAGGGYGAPPQSHDYLPR